MKAFVKLCTFTLVIIILIGSYWIAGQRWADNQIAKRTDIDTAIYLRKDLPKIFNSFRDTYHRWPGEPGPISDECWAELMGVRTAKLNTQHIDFFYKNNVLMMLQDRSGKGFTFKIVKKDGVEQCEFATDE